MNWRIGVILTTIAIALLLLLWRPFTSDIPVTSGFDPAELQPDFVAEGLFTKLFNPTGELQHRIESRRMAHYSVIGLTELAEPLYITTVTTQDGQTQVWQLVANEGRYHNDERLELIDNVRITNVDGTAFLQALETDYLHIQLDTQDITSDYSVHAYGPQFEVRGQGLRANFEAQQVELINHVQTIYYPHSPARSENTQSESTQ